MENNTNIQNTEENQKKDWKDLICCLGSRKKENKKEEMIELETINQLTNEESNEQKQQKLVERNQQLESIEEIIEEDKIEVSDKENKLVTEEEVIREEGGKISVQKWLDKKYHKWNRSEIKEIHLNESNLEGELDLKDFTWCYSDGSGAVTVYISSSVDETKLAFINKPEKAKIILENKDAQRYVDFYYSQEQREKIKELDISIYRNNYKKLEGKLNLSDFTSLKKLNCSGNLLTDLDFNTLSEKLTELNLSNNNISTRDLNCFTRFTKIERLEIGTGDQEKNNQNIYNRWIGSLAPLKNLNKLEKLDISNTDLNEGVEYLPSSLKEVKYSFKEGSGSKVQKIAEQLKYFPRWVKRNFNGQEYKKWLDLGLQPTDYYFAIYLRNKGYYPEQTNLNLTELRTKYYKVSQGWLEKNYPLEQRNKVKRIYLNEPNLEGELDLEEFTYCDGWMEIDDRRVKTRGVKVCISPSVDETKLAFKNQGENVKIIMNSWVEIHEGFAKESYQRMWEENDLTYQDAQEWIPFGFKPWNYGEVNQWKNYNFSPQETKSWMEIGLKPNSWNDHFNYIELAAYLRRKNYKPNKFLQLSLKLLKKQFTTWEKKIKSVQEYLAAIYLKEQRNTVKELNIREKHLTGNLDLSDFINLEILDCSGNELTSLKLNNCLKLKRLYCGRLIVDKDGGRRSKSHQLGNQLTELKVDHLVSLIELDCQNNQLTSLNLSNCQQLKVINCENNRLQDLKLPPFLEQLSCLNIRDNNFSEEDLSNFSDLFKGKMWIGNTKREKSKKGEKYGLCLECNQPNTGKEWCQSCNSQYLRFKNWVKNQNSGSQIVDEYIQKNQLEATNADKFLEWIPYEQLTNIEYLATGGFGEIFKANWLIGNKGNPITKWNKEKNQVINIVNNKENYGRIIDRGLIENMVNDRVLVNLITRGDKYGYWNIVIDNKKRKGWYKRYISTYFGSIPFSREFRHYPKRFVVLKSLNNSQNITQQFLQEVTNHKLVESEMIVSCFGISQDPETKNYVMVMDYIKDGDLRKYLQNSQKNNHNENSSGQRIGFSRTQKDLSQDNELELSNKIKQLFRIAQGLNQIHSQGLVHQDLHAGNILGGYDGLYITDLGLCKPVNETNQEKSYGVLPYVAPEVLQGEPYAQASDIYSFGIIAYELFANGYPYYEQKDLSEQELSTKICLGLRPSIDKVLIPKLLKDLIKICWDADPENRPNIKELYEIISNWKKEIRDKKDTEFYQQCLEVEDEYNTFFKNTPYQIHSTATVHSRLINTKEIVAKLLQNPTDEQILDLEIKKIEQEINQILADEQKELVKDFIQNGKAKLKNKRDKEIRSKFKELNDKLEKSLTKENTEKIIKYCERFIKLEQQLETEKSQQANIEVPPK